MNPAIYAVWVAYIEPRDGRRTFPGQRPGTSWLRGGEPYGQLLSNQETWRWYSR